MNKVTVIGGGASGIMAAIMACRNGGKVTLLEKNQRIGKKILMTGNGRCNFTNINVSNNDYNSDFVLDAIGCFSPQNVIDFFKELGLLSVMEDRGRSYPMSEQASAVLDVLLMEVERLKIDVKTEFDATKITKKGNGFWVESKDKKSIYADRVIVATGGMAAPKTGSNGDGYKILEKLGHKITDISPALVQLKTDRSIQGVRANANVKIKDRQEFGEVQFTSYGLSGIPIFNLSGYAENDDKVYIDLVPQMDESELYGFLKTKPIQKLETFLVGIVNKQLGQLLLKDCNIGKLSRKTDTLKDEEIAVISYKLKNWDFTVTGKMSWENAQVTKGGIALEEIDSKTMESKIVKGLFVTGELLDIDGICGGFNLQWAWSSGAVAGKMAAL